MQNLSESQNQQMAAAEILKRRKSRRGLLAFTEYTMPAYRTNWHHKLLADQLDRVASGEVKRLMVCMPPRHGKSELVSMRFPAYMLGKNPNLRVMGCSYAATLSTDNSRKIQRIIDSDQYRVLFPDTKLSGKAVVTNTLGKYKRTGDEFEIIDHTGGYLAAGVGGGIAGKGFDLGLCDDPLKNREEADSAVIRDKVWDWWQNDFLTRQSREFHALAQSS